MRLTIIILHISMSSMDEKIVIYKTKNGPQMDVRLEQETVWLTQKQMSQLFGKDVRTINEHIGNVFRDGELKKIQLSGISG